MIYSASKLVEITDPEIIAYFLQQKTSAIKDILIIKQSINQVKVIVDKPKDKLHGWGVKDITIKQLKKDQNGNSGWITQTIPFHGELILTILDSFNNILCKEILENLALWCQRPIYKLVKLNKFEQASLGFEHSFFLIEDCVYSSKIKLIESKCWSSSQFDNLVTIAQLQGLQIKNTRSIEQMLIQQSSPIKNDEYQQSQES